jgi:hypothetical protein
MRHAPSAQAPAVHAAPALAKEHERPQAPQLSVVVVGVSQPLAGFMSQSAKPALQAPIAHAPIAQVAAALAKEQAVPHVPQSVAVVRRSVSQPLAGLPSQSAKPSLQRVIAQVPVWHAPVALGKVQARPHIPQCIALAVVSVSQPLAALASQSPKPALQRSTEQRPATHAGVPLATVHAAPQAPQAATLVVVSTQAPSQQVAGAAQGRVGEQPATHTEPTQRVLVGQWSSTRH